MVIPAPDTRCLSLLGTVIETYRYYGAWVGETHVTDERRVRCKELALLICELFTDEGMNE